MGGDGERSADAMGGSDSAGETATVMGVNTAAGGANWTAATGVAAESADSMWQHAVGALTAGDSVRSGPWQQPPLPASAPGATGPRWQKQSPAEAFINAAASTTEPIARSRGFMQVALE